MTWFSDQSHELTEIWCCSKVRKNYVLSFINHFFWDAKHKNSLSWTRGVYILLGSPLSLSLFFLPPILHLPQQSLPRSVEEDSPLEGTRDLAADQSRKREVLSDRVHVQNKRGHMTSGLKKTEGWIGQRLIKITPGGEKGNLFEL